MRFRSDSDTGRPSTSTAGGQPYETCWHRFVDDRGWAGVLPYEASAYLLPQPAWIPVRPDPTDPVTSAGVLDPCE